MQHVGVLVTTGDKEYIDGLVQDCSNSSALAMELLQSCAKPPIWQYSVTKGVPWHHKSPGTPLFVEQLFKLTTEKPKFFIIGPYAKGIHQWLWIPLTKGQWCRKCFHCHDIFMDWVFCYKVLFFSKTNHNRCHIADVWQWDMGCILWNPSLMLFCISSLCCM